MNPPSREPPRSVLFVNHSMAMGGIETLIVDLAQALRGHGFTPTVAVFEGGGSLERRLSDLRIPVYSLDKREGVDLRMVSRLRRLIERSRFDVVHSHNFSTWLYTALAARSLRRRVLHVHTEHSNVEYRARRYWLERLLGRLTTYTVAVSAAVRDTMIRDIGIPVDRVRLIYNGVDVSRFAPDLVRRRAVRHKLGVDADCVLIGIVARLAAVKDHATLLQAFARLRQSTAHRVQLLLIGEGPERSALEREIAAHQLGADVRLVGERHDTPDWLRALDIYVLSSISEGMNLTLLEAMSTALPVVATAVGGNLEIVRAGDTGLLVPPRDAAAMATALLRLSESEELRRRMGAAGRERVERHFSQESMLQDYVGLYRGTTRGPVQMRLLLYSSQFPTPRDPNGGIFTAQLARALAARASLEVVCPLPWCPDLPWFRRHPQWGAVAGVPARGQHGDIAVRYPKFPLVPRMSGPLHPLLQAAAVWFALRRHLRAQAYDVIHAHWLYPDGVAAALLGKWLRVPVVLTALGSDVNVYADYRLRRVQIRWAMHRARAVTAVSRALRDRLATLMRDVSRLHYIPNGVDTARFFPLDAAARGACRHRLGLDPRKRYLLFVGRLHPVKGLTVLLDALALLVGQSRLTFDTVLVGDGEERARLERQARELGLGERVVFRGERPHAEIPGWLQATDVFCLPSSMEGMPNVVLEALACGVPVVATRVGAVPDIIDPRTGIVVEPGSAADLAAALHEAFDRDWRPADSAPPAVCDWENVARQYLSVLRAPT